MLKSVFGLLKKPKASTPVADAGSSTTAKAEPASTAVASPSPVKPAAPAVAAAPVARASKVVNGRVQLPMFPEDRDKSLAAKYRDAVSGEPICEYLPGAAERESAEPSYQSGLLSKSLAMLT